MTPGTILFDKNFVFKDGKKGKKLFVVLNDGSNEIYVCVKTTSKNHRYGIVAGCQALDRFPSFFVPRDASCLEENTWIQLEVFYEFGKAELIEKVLSGKIVQIGTLNGNLIRKLLVCATHSEDVTAFQRQQLLRQLDKIDAADPK